MSRVFVAVEHALGRTVVVKVLKPELGAGVNRERFRREIMLAAQLQHPHIVPVLNAGEHGDLLWYTMPFVEGVSLRDSLVHAGKFSARTVTRVLHDVLDALAYAHRRGVVHRDIKPGNILHHGSHSLVTDFGVAKSLSASMPHSGTTSVGIAIGTPAYMAPEQRAARGDVDSGSHSGRAGERRDDRACRRIWAKASTRTRRRCASGSRGRERRLGTRSWSVRRQRHRCGTSVADPERRAHTAGECIRRRTVSALDA